MEEIYEYGYDDRLPLWKQIITLPFSIMADVSYYGSTNGGILTDSVVTESTTGGITPGSFNSTDSKAESITSSTATRKRLFNYKYTS